jgi:hypothetical protein
MIYWSKILAMGFAIIFFKQFVNNDKVQAIVNQELIKPSY